MNRPDGAPSPAEGQQLCLTCGMCCRGDLYRRAGLDPDDEPGARSLGLPIVQDGPERPAFQLPCPKLDENRCTVYDDERKPSVCSTFECKLLKRYLGGEIDREQSLEHIARARDLIDGLRAEIGGTGKAPIWTELSEWAESRAEREVGTRMRVGQLMRMLSTTFLPPVDQAGPGDWPPTMAE